MLTPRGSARLDNRELLLALFDCAAAQYGDGGAMEDEGGIPSSSTASFLRNSGVFYNRSTPFHMYNHVTMCM